jgi:hypothetical protein
MSQFDVVNLGASTVSNGIPTYSATSDVDGQGGVETFAQLEAFQALGLHAVPYPADDNGSAEAVVLRDCGGGVGCVIGARDTRTAGMTGNLKAGDTALCSTHPNQSAQLLLKGEKRQAVLATRGKNNKQIILLLDGNNDKIQINGFGMLIEMDGKTKEIYMSAGGSGGIIVNQTGGNLLGNWVVGGMTPFMPVAMQAPGTAGITSLPAPGFFIGV